ncbi:haloacid dehalogenase-like hydrolase (HAD) superfamily protein [Actinidia rufa]|uniref:Mitochondrial import inner membrane translocase subunit TIM50 n=1 Tax=Actinidia rufa TaxID=165716 RepID=A0A7J0GP99_9ERIC|nr:haloacid dehalogenase-like hydrolase (HAD) superfamily protein [Actinidia rufa]
MRTETLSIGFCPPFSRTTDAFTLKSLQILPENRSSPPLPSSTTKQPPPHPPPPHPSSSGTEKKSWGFLKYSLVAALTGGVATAGYATYAYTLDEVDEKTKALRASAKYTVEDDASALDKFQALLYSTGMTVPSKLVELYLDLRRMTEEHVRGFTEPTSDKLLPDLHPMEQHVFTLVLDLNETLIYSDWKRDRGWRTFKRPGVDAFLEHLAQFYEIIVYSDQLNMYVDPVVDRLDPKHCIRFRLSRGATRYQDGKHYRVLCAWTLYLLGTPRFVNCETVFHASWTFFEHTASTRPYAYDQHLVFLEYGEIKRVGSPNGLVCAMWEAFECPDSYRVGGKSRVGPHPANFEAQTLNVREAWAIYAHTCSTTTCYSSRKDLSKLNRDPAKILYVSGHALESNLQPENGVPIKPWKLEEDDTALLDLIPFLECRCLLDIGLLTFDLC